MSHFSTFTNFSKFTFLCLRCSQSSLLSFGSITNSYTPMPSLLGVKEHR